MDLMNEYLEGMSGHIHAKRFDKSSREFVVEFLRSPEDIVPVSALRFVGVSEFSEEVVDASDEPCMDLAIGIDRNSQGQYCLHTSLVEFNFKAREHEYIQLSHNQTFEVTGGAGTST